MFHKHLYIYNEITKQYNCPCGKHYCQHKWKHQRDISGITDIGNKGIIGSVLECTICGDLKNHYIND